VRVLLVSWEYPPLLIGGLGRHVGMLAPELAALGHDVRVVTIGRGPEPTVEQDGAVRVYRTAAVAGSLPAAAAAGGRALAELGRRAIAGWRPDVVHGHDWLTALPVERLRRLAGAGSAVTLHATESGRQQGWLTGPVPRRIHRVEHRMCTAADLVLVCSRYMADQARTLFGVPADRLRVVGNGAVALLVAEVERPPHSLVFAGRLVHEKGLQELIKALPLLAERFPDVRLTVAGDGPLADAQRDRAARYRVADRVRWLGFTDDVAGQLAGAAVAVVPSLYEPFGLVAVEAQLAGTPVAVADAGGLRELVAPGRTGVRFTPESPSAIAAAVADLFDRPVRASRLARTARRRALAEFSWPAVAARTAAAYQELERG